MNVKEQRNHKTAVTQLEGAMVVALDALKTEMTRASEAHATETADMFRKAVAYADSVVETERQWRTKTDQDLTGEMAAFNNASEERDRQQATLILGFLQLPWYRRFWWLLSGKVA